ncbi:MAG: hypothetical protein IPI46_02540 [Bacteroidetes bacterium]|nr:hypothetical protein [Bacteroidota bacterium]
MEKRIPIDDLFHDKLSRGKEQLNLGAWANMERLLDGQNPYTEEEKKKRRILPLFLLLLIGAATFTAGYIVKQTYYPSAAESQGIAKVASKNQKAMDATLSSMQVDETDAKNTNADHSLMAANKEESTTVSNQAKLNDTKYNSSHLQTSNHTNQQDLIKSSTTGVTSNRASKNSKKQGVAQNTTSIGAVENKLSSANASNNDNLKIQKEKNKNFAKSSTTQNQMQDRLNNSSVTNSIIETKTMPMVEINQKLSIIKMVLLKNIRPILF